MLKLFKELKRRKVLTTLGAYAAAAFIIIQVAEIVFPRILIPDWAVTFVIVLAILGFPITFFLSWTYDLKREAEADNKLDHKDLPQGKKSKKILLPITGFLTIVGIAFWTWYSLGSMSHGAEIDNKIFKSIAVMYLDNHSSNIEDDNLCAALTDGIITSLSKLGIFSVKSRTDVLKFRKKITSHEEIERTLRVDAYIEGSIIKSSDNKNYHANIQLIDVKNGTNLWAGNYEKAADEILYIPDLIATDVSTALGTAISSNIITSDVSSNTNNKTFSLLGEGLNLLDGGEYPKSVAIFDSLLKIEPNNMRAAFSRGQALEKMGNYANAVKVFEEILPLDDQLSRAEKIWGHPNINNQSKLGDIRLYNKFLVSEKHNIQIIPSTIKDQGQIIFAIDLKTKRQIWKKSLIDPNPSMVIVDDELFLFTRTLGNQKNEATIYGYNLKNGKQLFIDEIPRKNISDRVMPSIIKLKGDVESKLENMIFLSVRRNETYELMLFDTDKLNIVWKHAFPLKSDDVGESLLYFVTKDNQNFIFHAKGAYLYLLSVKDGSLLWEKILEDKSDKYLVHNNKIIFYSKEKSLINILNIIDQNVIASYNKINGGVDSLFILDNNIIVQSDRRITSLQTRSRFFKGILNWQSTFSDDIITVKTILNNVFVLIRSGGLYCVNGKSGKINTESLVNDYSNVDFYHDDTKNSLVVFDGFFLMGLDPNNGKSLWKIREFLHKNKNHNHSFKIELSGNRLIVLKPAEEKSQLIIKTYNRNNGELLWFSDENLWTDYNREVLKKGLIFT